MDNLFGDVSRTKVYRARPVEDGDRGPWSQHLGRLSVLSVDKILGPGERAAGCVWQRPGGAGVAAGETSGTLHSALSGSALGARG